jgi:hypothetical protein
MMIMMMTIYPVKGPAVLNGVTGDESTADREAPIENNTKISHDHSLFHTYQLATYTCFAVHHWTVHKLFGGQDS